MWLIAYESSRLYKEKVKTYHDKKLLKEDFKPGQRVLLFNSRLKLFSGKLKSKWSGPFVIKKVWSYGAIELYDPQSQNLDRTWVVNGQRLKLYHGEEFTQARNIVHLINHWGKSVKLVTLKKRFLGGNPVPIYVSLFYFMHCIMSNLFHNHYIGIYHIVFKW